MNFNFNENHINKPTRKQVTTVKNVHANPLLRDLCLIAAKIGVLSYSGSEFGKDILAKVGESKKSSRKKIDLGTIVYCDF